jgi:hypothetical protein
MAAGALPLKDVPTRWNSKELAIRRAIKVRATIKIFCIRYRGDKCPQIDDNAFRILELIQPALKVFKNITLTYSESTATIHHAISNLHDDITDLRSLHDQVSMTEARQASYLAAVGKLEKYLLLLLQNNWVCAAFALNPPNRAAVLRALFETYRDTLNDTDLSHRYEEVVQ